MNFFEFTKQDYNKIVEECMLDEEYGIKHTTLNDRLNRGWTLEQALTIPTNGTHRKVFE